MKGTVTINEDKTRIQSLYQNATNKRIILGE